MAQHQIGHLEEKHMIQICKSHDKDIFSKFVRDENGLFFNERLESEVIKRKKYSLSRSENRKKREISETYVEHMENENKDILIGSIKHTILAAVDNGTWESEKKLFLNSEQWQMKQCTEFKLNKNQILVSINEFLNELENTEDYKSEKELKKHWYHWYKKKSTSSPQVQMSDYQKNLLQQREAAKKRTA